MPALRLLLLLSVATLVAAPAASAQGSGRAGSQEEGAIFLLLPVGAQGVGMGRAMTGIASAEGAFWNPAGLARSGDSRVLLLRGEHVAGDATGFSLLVERPELGTAGVSYGLLDFGTQDLTDGSGNLLGSITVRGHQGIVSAATALSERIALGINAKLIQFSQSCRGQCPDGGGHASTYAVDLGVQLQPLADRALRVGAMVAHLGPALRVRNVEEREPLPTRIRLAAGYDAPVASLLEEEISLQLFLEVEDRLRDPGAPSFYLGTQVSAGSSDRLYLRGGYIFENRTQTDGAALGLGFRYERFDFGIARSLPRGGPSPDQEPVHLSLAVSF